MTCDEYKEFYRREARSLPGLAEPDEVAECMELHPHPADSPQAPPPAPGLGDRLESLLTRVGLTKDRYREIKGELGLPPTCDCDKRQEWLNKVGEKFGDAAKSAFSRIFRGADYSPGGST